MSDAATNRQNTQSAVAERNRKIVYLALTASAFFWGAGFAVGRFALRSVSPLGLLAGQYALVIPVEITIIASSGGWRRLLLPRPLMIPVLALGLVGQNILSGFTYFGLNFTTATNAALVYGLSPVLIGIFAALFLGESFGTRKRIGALLGFAGAAVIITQGHFASLNLSGPNGRFMAGNLLVFGGALYWAAYSVATRRLAQRVAAEVYTFYIMTLPVLIPILALWWKEHRLPFSGVDVRTFLAIAFMGIGTTVLAMNFWVWGLSKIEASSAGVFSYLEPLFAGLVAAIFLGERLTGATTLGAVLVFAGIFLMTKA